MRTLQLVSGSGKLVRKIEVIDPFGVDVDEDELLWICSSAQRRIEVAEETEETKKSEIEKRGEERSRLRGDEEEERDREERGREEETEILC